MEIFNDSKLAINLPVLVDSRMLLCANSGGGKSYALRKILEEAGTEVMSIILDVEGEFKTLREKFDFLLIGNTGDVPLSMKAAHLLPQKLMELNVSAIIDISDLKMHDRILYVKKFLEALMELQREFWKPCLVVVDEAHMYAGQQEKQESTHAVIDLMTRGRKRGFCGILATQRIAKLHKDAAAEANNYMVGRTGLDVDMRRAAEILGFASKESMLSLRNLEAGEFYVFGPAISRGVENVRVGKVQTTHPKVGMDIRGKITPPTAKIKAMLSKLSDLPKEAEEKARTLEDAKQRIRELEKQLKQLPESKPDQNQIDAAEARGHARAEKGFKETLSSLANSNQKLKRKLKQIAELCNVEAEIPQLDSKIMEGVKPSFQSPPCEHFAHKPLNLPANRRKRIEKSFEMDETIDTSKNLGRCERSILSLLYNNMTREFTKILIGLFTGYSHKSGGFNNAICRLNAMNLIERNRDLITLSDEGVSMAPIYLGDDLRIHEQFTIDNWAEKLPKCESMIFQFLMQNSSQAFSKQELGDSTGYQPGSGGFNNAICRLNSLGLIVRQNGNIQINREILK